MFTELQIQIFYWSTLTLATAATLWITVQSL